MVRDWCISVIPAALGAFAGSMIVTFSWRFGGSRQP
jgi:hypothetical protein